MKLLFQYYLLLFFFFIIFTSNMYKKTKFKINNMQIINNTYKDYLFWKEGAKIKKQYIKLSINTLYNKNTLKKENIEFLSLPYLYQNINYDNIILLPKINLLYKNYLVKKDIAYFDVKTPVTQVYYENSLYGQLLQTNFTQNIQSNLNYSIHSQLLYPKNKKKYKLLPNNYFLATLNYHDIKNKYYKIWMHYINDQIQNFNQLPILNNHIFQSQRFYIAQYLKLQKKIFLIDRLEYEGKKYFYKEKKYKNFFGNVYINEPRTIQNKYNKLFHELTIQYFINKKNFFNSGIGYYNFIYFPYLRKIKIQNKIFSIFGNIHFNLFKNININIFSKYLVFYPYNYSYYIFFKTKYNNSFNSIIESRFCLYNLYPSFNIMLNNSFYKQNTYFHDYKNIIIKKLYFNIYNKYINLSINIYNINNYINFLLYKSPMQYLNKVNFMKFNISKLFTINNIKYNFFLQFHNNNIIYFPTFLIRNSLFYENLFFKKKIFFQTGIVMKHIINNFYKNYNINTNTNTNTNTEDLSYNIIKNLTFIDYFFNIEFFRLKIYFLIENFNINKFLTYNKLTENINYNKEFLIKVGFLWNMFT